MDKRNATSRRQHPRSGAVVTPIGDPLTVRAKLALLGWPSLHAWARAHGYDRNMATYCVATWANRADRLPHGGISRALMRDLRETLEMGKRPDQVEKAVA